MQYKSPGGNAGVFHGDAGDVFFVVLAQTVTSGGPGGMMQNSVHFLILSTSIETA